MTSPRPTQVHAELSLRLVVPDGTSLPVASTLSYHPGDPYAIHVAFHTGGPGESGEVVWTFARQLMVDGVNGPAGMGDVRVWPVADADAVALALSSPSGEALFEIPRGALASFLMRTFAEVPLGYEHDYVDLDAELAILLRETF